MITDQSFSQLWHRRPSCPSGCNCALRVIETVPSGYSAVSASAPSPATVLSSTVIRYPNLTPGQYQNYNFVLSGPPATIPTVWRYYHYAGSQRISVRVSGDPDPSKNGVFYPLTDHLGSTSITADGATGARLSELRYKPRGELRYASQPTTTGLRFTGQRMEGIGLYDYGARWYDNIVIPGFSIHTPGGYYGLGTVGPNSRGHISLTPPGVGTKTSNLFYSYQSVIMSVTMASTITGNRWLPLAYQIK